VDRGGRRLLRAKLLALSLVLGALAAGCAGSMQNEELVIGDIGWDENIAIANLTKVLLEDDLGYDEVRLKQTDSVRDLFQGVSTGEMNAFQDVWMPQQKVYLGEVEDQVEQLDSWYRGTTRYSIATPSYMGITSIDQLNGTGATEILGIEPDVDIMEAIPDSVIPEYGLEQRLVQSSTQGMLAEVDNRYDNREEFAFVAWSPHWMNQRYDFEYLDDPKGALGDLTQSAEILTIVDEDLPDDDPVAYAFMDALTLDEEQLNDLESTINELGDPLEGARRWARENPDIVEPWVEAAERARGS
jgi:glycine betaine/proline transport system substrate-binding protein